MKKAYKFMCTGQWLARNCRKCCCHGPHVKLMDEVVGPDGKIQVSGNKYLKASGSYTKNLGRDLLMSYMQKQAFRVKEDKIQRGKTPPIAKRSKVVHNLLASQPATSWQSTQDPWADVSGTDEVAPDAYDPWS